MRVIIFLGDDVMYGLGGEEKDAPEASEGKKSNYLPITLANITPAYGDANNINSLTVTIHGNGRPAIGTTRREGMPSLLGG